MLQCWHLHLKGDMFLVILTFLCTLYSLALPVLKFVAHPGGLTAWRSATIGPGK